MESVGRIEGGEGGREEGMEDGGWSVERIEGGEGGREGGWKVWGG